MGCDGVKSVVRQKLIGDEARVREANEHIEEDGPTVFAHACKLGLEGIVSKRKDSTYRSGRSPIS